MNDIQATIDAINSAEAKPIPEDFQDTLAMIGAEYSRAKEYLVGNKDASLIPTWTAITKNGQFLIVATPFEGGERHKDMVAQAMERIFNEINAERYTFISEAWMARVDKDEYDKDRRPPSQRDDRMEVLIIMGGDKDGSQMRTYEIIRDDEGIISDLKLDPASIEMSGPQVEGRFANLLRREA